MDNLDTLVWRLEQVERMIPCPFDWVAEILEQMLNHPAAADELNLAYCLETLARSYSRVGRHGEAIRTMQRALEERARLAEGPDHREILAELLVRAGRVDEADTLYATLIAENVDKVELHITAGMAYQWAGNHRRALHWIDEGLTLALQTPDSDDWIKRLTALRGHSTYALLQSEFDQFVAQSRPIPPSRKRTKRKAVAS